MKRILAASIVLFFLSFSHGCGSDSSGPTVVPPSGVENASLSVGAVSSVGRVGVAGLPAAKSTQRGVAYSAVLKTPNNDDIEMPLDSDSEGWYFTAPFHPATPNDGGTFQVTITDGESSSEAHSLEVSALPASPGSFASLVATMRTHLEQRAEFAGTSVAELKSTPAAEVAPGLIPLKLAQSYLDSDDDSHDLTDLVANADDFLSAEHAELLDSVLGFFDLEHLLQEEINAWEALPAASALSFAKSVQGEGCFHAKPPIETAPELSIAMIRSAVAQFGADPNSPAGAILTNGGRVLSTLSVVPSVGIVAGVGGVLVASAQGVTGFSAGTMPTSFVSITAEVEQATFNEDSVESTKYKNVDVVAASTGWSADKSLASVAINSLGVYLSIAEKAKILGSEVLRDVALVDLGAGAGVLFGDTDLIEFCPETWEIDISSPLYCTAASLLHKFEVDIEAQTVTPKEVGPDELRVAAQATKFGERTIAIDLPMEVKWINVDVSPSEHVVAALGDTVMITATIEDADLTTLRWTSSAGAWDDGLGSDTNDGRTRPLITPASPDDYPVLVTVESLSRNGLRSSGLPPRVDFATIYYRDSTAIFIEPQDACIAPGESQQFTASGVGLEGYTVVWEVISGSGTIDQNGLYQSLAGDPTSAIVEASLAENEDVRHDAYIEASACKCSIEVAITGGVLWDYSGTDVKYATNLGDDYYYTFLIDLSDPEASLMAAYIYSHDGQPSPQPGSTGTWTAGFEYSPDAETTWQGSIRDDDPVQGMSVTITEFTDTDMIGYFHGTIHRFGNEGEIIATAQVNAPFRAKSIYGGSGACD